MCVYSIPEGRIILHKQVHDPGFESRELMVCENGRLVSGDRNDRFRFFNESGRCVRSGPNGNNLWDAVPAGLAPSGNYWCSETDHMLRAWQFPVNDPVAPWSLTRIQSTREVLDSAEQFRLLMEKAKEARILRRFGEAFSLCLQARQLPGRPASRQREMMPWTPPRASQPSRLGPSRPSCRRRPWSLLLFAHANAKIGRNGPVYRREQLFLST